MALEDFHLRKEVTIGNIFTTVMLAVTLVLGWADLNNRAENNDARLTKLEQKTLENFNFQVQNRQRVFDQINQLRDEVQSTKVALARWKAVLKTQTRALTV
jgi:hypothetical protein